MLNDEGCQGLNRVCDLAASRDIAILKDVSEDMHKLAGPIMRRWWKPHGLPKAIRRLEAAHVATVSDYDD
jgi:hypothetical protein